MSFDKYYELINNVIKEMGLEEFRKTSFFMSNQKST